MPVGSSDPAGQQITACIPYFRCQRYIRRAVECLLEQTHRDMTVVVVNDGDPNPPWELLAHIKDPRLVRFSLASNYGPYFTTAIVARATSAPYFLIQDADDWSAPTRAQVLLEQLLRDCSDLAVSAQPQYVDNGRRTRIVGTRWSTISSEWRSDEPFVVRSTLTADYMYRSPHHGLFRTEAIRRVGGYYGGFRVSYDKFLTNLILMTGRISHVRQPLYYRLLRPESLTHSPATAYRSPEARSTRAKIHALYRCCFRSYSSYLDGTLDSASLNRSICACAMRHVKREELNQLAFEAGRLKQLLRSLRRERT